MVLILKNSFCCPLCRGTIVGKIRGRKRFFCANCDAVIEYDAKGDAKVYRFGADGEREKVNV